MDRRKLARCLWVLFVALIVSGVVEVIPGSESDAQKARSLKFLRQDHDPAGWPRPAPGARNVPLRTSYFFQLAVDRRYFVDLLDSLTVQLVREDGETISVFDPRSKFAPGYSGGLEVVDSSENPKEKVVSVYIDAKVTLLPETVYAVRVQAALPNGERLDEHWQFRTEPPPRQHEVSYRLSLDETAAVQWHGSFFSGVVKPGFATSAMWNIGYDLMKKAREEYPNAWTLQRDFWLTGFDHEPNPYQIQPNIVRELETRRIVAMERQEQGVLLRVEDVFGGEQYGIPPGRPVSGDYREGDEVLIADGRNSVRAKVLATNDAEGTVLVSGFPFPPEGWQIDYTQPLPKAEDPRAPGLFPAGGTYLRKFKPPGTPVYYWGRLDKEWDIVLQDYGPILIPGFNDAPGDLAVDGRSWTTAKDYVQLHEVTYQIVSHLIERYGEITTKWRWSVFNEPDLQGFFWRSNWAELQKFYDYTVDAILKAFEDHGYDSAYIMVGGLELGAIFGTNLKLREFLAHASPRAFAPGALPYNAAYADPRLDGKRSRRVEKLAGANNGKGTPLDFISIHTYNRAELVAEKLIRAKAMALEIDPDYYQDLWVNSYESAPYWNPIPDRGAAEIYLGNGYWSTWIADVVRRLLKQAALDSRYGFGESILTVWPWPAWNLDAINSVVREVHVDDDGDGVKDRSLTLPYPEFHLLNLLSTMGGRYWVLPEEEIYGHIVSGFASRNDHDLRLLVYAHNWEDLQCRSERTFRIKVRVQGLEWPEAHVRVYRFDRNHNTYYTLARELKSDPGYSNQTALPREEVEKLERLSSLQLTETLALTVSPNGDLELDLEVAGNGVAFVVVEPAK